MIGKHFTETLNKVQLRINRVRTNRARPVLLTSAHIDFTSQVKLTNSFISGNDRPFGCPIICTDLYSQCYCH